MTTHSLSQSRKRIGPRAVTALTLCTLLGACTLLGNKSATPLQTYRLDGDSPPSEAAKAPAFTARHVLLVEVPHAAAGYDSTRMVYVRQPQTQEAFAHSAWADTPARMLAPLLVEHLQNSGHLRAVLLAPSAAQAGLRLDSTLLRLQQDFLQVPSRVRFSLQLTLVDNRTRKVLAWHTVDVTHVAASDDAAGGAAAAHAAVQSGLQQVSTFLQTTLAVLPAGDLR